MSTENSPEPAAWLVCDTETTGLFQDDPRADRVGVLEVAWMLVNAADLSQLTPLRQRITALWETPGWLLVPPDPTEWADIRMDPKVRALHEETGLARDWATGARISAVAELDELLGADVEAARAKLGDPEARIHLAGAGVAQFESRLLPRIGSQVAGWCHYRCADTSVASMVAGVPKVGGVCWDGVTSLDLQSGLAAAGVEHRAAADVLVSYALARRLRSAVLG